MLCLQTAGRFQNVPNGHSHYRIVHGAYLHFAHRGSSLDPMQFIYKHLFGKTVGAKQPFRDYHSHLIYFSLLLSRTLANLSRNNAVFCFLIISPSWWKVNLHYWSIPVKQCHILIQGCEESKKVCRLWLRQVDAANSKALKDGILVSVGSCLS